MLDLIREVHSFAGQISEVDVGDPENLKITLTVGERAVRLLLGNQGFLLRLRNFLNHYPEFRRRLPKTAAFDLRLDDRITAMEGSPHGK
jgi:cell division protein FtsQ